MTNNFKYCSKSFYISKIQAEKLKEIQTICKKRKLKNIQSILGVYAIQKAVVKYKNFGWEFFYSQKLNKNDFIKLTLYIPKILSDELKIITNEVKTKHHLTNFQCQIMLYGIEEALNKYNQIGPEWFFENKENF
jgi:hypothetical protein